MGIRGAAAYDRDFGQPGASVFTANAETQRYAYRIPGTLARFLNGSVV